MRSQEHGLLRQIRNGQVAAVHDRRGRVWHHVRRRKGEEVVVAAAARRGMSDPVLVYRRRAPFDLPTPDCTPSILAHLRAYTTRRPVAAPACIKDTVRPVGLCDPSAPRPRGRPPSPQRPSSTDLSPHARALRARSTSHGSTPRPCNCHTRTHLPTASTPHPTECQPGNSSEAWQRPRAAPRRGQKTIQN